MQSTDDTSPPANVALAEPSVARDIQPVRVTGRPSAYKPEEHDRIAGIIGRLGGTMADLASACGVTLTTVTAWTSRYPSFQASFTPGREEANRRVRHSLYLRACGYDVEEATVTAMRDTVTGAPIVVMTSRHIPADPKAAEMWLRNCDPDWRSVDPVRGVGVLIISNSPDTEGA